MIRYYQTIEGKMTQCEQYAKGCWVNVTAPSPEEIASLVADFDLDPNYISESLDDEESSHIEKEGVDTLLIMDTPMMQPNDQNVSYYTIPIGIIATRHSVITISLGENPVFDDFANGRIRDCNTDFKAKFILQLMFKTATRFLQHLKQIDKMSMFIEKQLRKSMRNKELIQLLELQKSLVYFNTSLASNAITIKKFSNGKYVRLYEEDEDFLEDVLIEIKQAQEMASIYLNILSGTMDAFASVISNNLNIVMKVLASITVVISIPTMISGFYGMNVGNIPIQNFWFPILLSAVVMGLAGLILYKKDMF
ncbi:MAG: magnesium transporter CorA family protein [Oscillospiraceae bacterium]